jgi:hypothetical protein
MRTYSLRDFVLDCALCVASLVAFYLAALCAAFL